MGGWSELQPFDEDCNRPYSARPVLDLRADPSLITLDQVLAEASHEFARTHPGDYSGAGQALDFFRGDLSETITPTIPMTTSVTTTDSNGLAVWHVRPSEATIADLVTASQRKVQRGDPLRPYLLVDPHAAMAGGVPGGWDSLLEIWWTLVAARGSWDVLRSFGDFGTATFAMLDRVADRWDRHRKAAQHTRSEFESRDADISDVIATTLASDEFRLADLMAWTGIDDPTVAADVAGWAGLEVNATDDTVSPIADESERQLASQFPMDVSLDVLGCGSDAADLERTVMEGLAEFLRDRDPNHRPDGPKG